MGSMPWLIAGLFVAAMVLFPVGVFIRAAILHFFAWMVGANRNGFEATVRAVCYGASPNLLAWVPCLGSFAGIYTIVLEVIAMQRMQETTGGRAAAAVLLPILVSCCVLAGAIFMVATLAASLGKS
jgi:hypothetical protein